MYSFQDFRVTQIRPISFHHFILFSPLLKFGQKYPDFLEDTAKTTRIRVMNSAGVTGTAKEVRIAIQRLEQEIYEHDWFHRALQ